MSLRADLLDRSRTDTLLIEALRRSMSESPRALPPTLAFDSVGHALSARTDVPGFSASEAEASLAETHLREILDAAGCPDEIVHLGAGTGAASRPFLPHVGVFAAIESCRPVLDATAARTALAYPSLAVRGVADEPVPGLTSLPAPHHARLILLSGNTLGRLDPTSARLELSHIRRTMREEDRLLVGLDLRHSLTPQDIGPGTDDVLSAIAQNALQRANREVGTDFSAADWRFVARTQPNLGRFELLFVARRRVIVNGGSTCGHWTFERGEALIVAHAYAPSEGQLGAAALGAGLSVVQAWRDEDQAYGLVLFAPALRRAYAL